MAFYLEIVHRSSCIVDSKVVAIVVFIQKVLSIIYL